MIPRILTPTTQNLRFLILLIIVSLNFQSCKKKETSQAPVAGFTIYNNGCAGPCTVTFNNTSTNATSYNWNFGDLSSGTSATSPSHIFETAGTYVVTLTAVGPGGSASTSQTVTIGSVTPAYYVSYKVNDTLVNGVMLTALRDTTSNPVSFYLTSYASGYNTPILLISIAASGTTFTNSFTANCNQNTTSDFFHYTNTSGTVYETELNTGGVTLTVTNLNYSNGGEIDATFSGKMQSSSGNVISITDGVLKMKFGD